MTRAGTCLGPEPGAKPYGRGCRFTVWAPHRRSVRLVLAGRPGPSMAMHKDARGYWSVDVEGVEAGRKYRYRMGNRDFADPASHRQPQGVFGPSQVVDHEAFVWTDAGFRPPKLEHMVVYELHAGTFTAQGDFDAARRKLDHLAGLGVNAVEVMPIAQFPGTRNWGYDGVFPFAAQESYGGPDGFKRFVDACHARSLAVVLDVVYNHLGPEGNVLVKFGPYLHQGKRTPWGGGFNFHAPDSHGVRDYVLHNAMHWLRRYHVDALRLDAASCIHDPSQEHILRRMGREVENLSREWGKEFVLMAETDENDAVYVTPRAKGGHGLQAAWSFDFHHCVHAALTGERQGFYADFGAVSHVAEAMNHGFVPRGQHSKYYGGPHGGDCRGCPGSSFVVYAQNHDMVGNRPQGERLASLVSFEAAKLAAAVVLLSPFVPLLFMGEEWAETRPFLYFTDHGDAGLNVAVDQGRKREYEAFGWGPHATNAAWGTRCTPPHAPATFEASLLDWSKPKQGRHATMLSWYTRLLKLRREHPVLAALDRSKCRADAQGQVLLVERESESGNLLCCYNFDKSSATVNFPTSWTGEQSGACSVLLDSSNKEWDGPSAFLRECVAMTEPLTLGPESAVILESA